MDNKIQLKRKLGLGLITFYGLGNILGAGIYVLIGKIAGHAGLYAPLSFVIASLVAAITAFSYAELSSRYPVSAGEAVYIQHGFNIRYLSMAIGFAIIFAGLVSSATIAHGFVGYLQIFIPIPDWLGLSCLIILLGAITAWGIQLSVGIAAVMTVLEIIGLVIIIFVGGHNLTKLPAQLHSFIPPLEADVWFAILFGAFLAFYAFIGFEDMVNVAEEVKEPQRNMPLGIFLALGIATFLYLIVSLVAVLTAMPEALNNSDAPLAMIYQEATGRKPVLIGLISMFAIVNGALIQMIMASRVLYGMSRQGWLPEILGRLHPEARTPVYSIIFVTTCILILALFLPLLTLAQITSYIVLLVFCFVNLALWKIKLRKPEPETGKIYPLWIPVLGFITTAGFIIFQLTDAISNRML